MNYRIAFAVTATIVILAILGITLTGFASDLLTEEEKKTVIELNTTEDWKNQRGLGFTNETIKYGKNRIGIKKYGERPFQASNYRTLIFYRTKVNEFTNLTRLDKLEADAYLGDEREDSFFSVAILDCGSLVRPGDMQSIRIYCNSNYVKYSTGNLKGSGKTEIERDLSNISVEGRIIIHTALGINTTEEVPKGEEPYIDRIKLTGKNQKSRLEFLDFN